MTTETLFTVDELLAVLTGAQPSPEVPDGAYTMKHLRQMMPGRSVQYIANLLRPHVESGAIECIRVPFVRIDGARTSVPAYRLRQGGGGVGGC
jgi:hypothetical protein